MTESAPDRSKYYHSSANPDANTKAHGPIHEPHECCGKNFPSKEAFQAHFSDIHAPDSPNYVEPTPSAEGVGRSVAQPAEQGVAIDAAQRYLAEGEDGRHLGEAPEPTKKGWGKK